MMAKSRRRIAVVALGGGDAGGGDRGSRVDGDHRRGGAAVQVFWTGKSFYEEREAGEEVKKISFRRR